MYMIRHPADCDKRTPNILGDAPYVFVDMVKVGGEYRSPVALDVKYNVYNIIDIGVCHICAVG